MENVKVIKLLSCTDKLYGLACNGSCGKRRTASRVTVKLCEYKTVKPNGIIECRRNIYSVLTGHGIHNKKYLMRMYRGLYVLKLFHEGFVNMKSSRRVKKYVIVSLVLRKLYGFCRYKNGILLSFFKDRNPDLFTYNL